MIQSTTKYKIPVVRYVNMCCSMKCATSYDLYDLYKNKSVDKSAVVDKHVFHIDESYIFARFWKTCFVHFLNLFIL